MENKITINDIVQIKNIMEVCSRRGAFQADELEVVGALYNRIKLFVDEVEAKSTETASNDESKPLETVPEDPAETTPFENSEKNMEMTVDESSN